LVSPFVCSCVLYASVVLAFTISVSFTPIIENKNVGVSYSLLLVEEGCRCRREDDLMMRVMLLV